MRDDARARDGATTNVCETVAPRRRPGRVVRGAGSISKGRAATLLREVSAAFPPGRVSALMGPSGAGKTTLLDVVSGRKTQGSLTGRVVVGTEPASKEALKTCAAYVEQFDCLLASLTVRETLAYQADLKRNRDDPRSAAERDCIVERLIEDLRLQKCADVVVGNALSRGISGGQAKARQHRTSVSSRDRECCSWTSPRAGWTRRRRSI